MLIDEAHNLGNEVEENYSEILNTNLVVSAIEQIESLKDKSVSKKGKHYKTIMCLHNILLNLKDIFELQKKYLKKDPSEIDISFLINAAFRDVDKIDNVISDIHDYSNLINNNNDISSEDEIEPLPKVIQFLYKIYDFNKNLDTPFVLTPIFVSHLCSTKNITLFSPKTDGQY
ncbi:MAG: hypothetical protein ACT6FF_10200, partial [Methanosarcinaceae archaeon]